MYSESRLNGMGVWEELLGAAAGGTLPGAGQSLPGGGTGGSSASTATSTTVSPTFQQSFSPQVSPVIQVSQGGGEQRGATSQIITGGQAAKGGEGAPAGVPSSGYEEPFGSDDFTSLTPAFSDFGPIPSPQQNRVFDYVFDRQPAGFNLKGWLIPGLLVLGGIALYANPPKRFRKKRAL